MDAFSFLFFSLTHFFQHLSLSSFFFLLALLKLSITLAIMESPQVQDTIQDKPNVSSPQEVDIEAPRDELQDRFDKQVQDGEASTSAQGIAAPLIVPQEQETKNKELESDAAAAAAAGSSTKTEIAGRGRGRGGRIPSSGSARGRGGNAAGKATAGRGGRGGASAVSSASTARGGKQAKASAAKSGRGGSAAKSKSKETPAAAGESVGGSSSGIAGVASSGSGSSNTVFPLARVSRIVKVDKEIEMTSKDAIWTIAIATELFIRHLTDSAYTKARLDKKKKTVTFKELASAVESQNEFFFLQDIIPQPIAFSKALQLRQEIEDRNHMREIGLFDEEEEDDDVEGAATERGVDGASTLINHQTIDDDAEDSRVLNDKTADIDEQGDVAMEEEQVR